MNLQQLSPLFSCIKAQYISPILGSVNPYMACVRWASKKASSSRRNLGGKSPGMRLGPKKGHGEFVYENQILVRQKMNFRYYPGQFVKTGKDKTLVAQVRGTMVFTRQRWNPNHKTAFGRSGAAKLSDKEMERTFVNIIPEEEVGRFKLVEQV